MLSMKFSYTFIAKFMNLIHKSDVIFNFILQIFDLFLFLRLAFTIVDKLVNNYSYHNAIDKYNLNK